jgi:hypothetical protein
MSGCAASAQQGPHAGKQFRKRKWFDQIIVGTQFQPFYAIIHAAARRQEQHRNLIPGCSYRLKDMPSVHAGQHDIQDDQVIRFTHGHVMAVEPGPANVDHKPRLNETLANVVRCFTLVFDNQQFHWLQ